MVIATTPSVRRTCRAAGLARLRRGATSFGGGAGNRPITPGAQLQVLGGPAAGVSRPVGDQELRAWAADVVHLSPEMERRGGSSRAARVQSSRWCNRASASRPIAL